MTQGAQLSRLRYAHCLDARPAARTHARTHARARAHTHNATCPSAAPMHLDPDELTSVVWSGDMCVVQVAECLLLSYAQGVRVQGSGFRV